MYLAFGSTAWSEVINLDQEVLDKRDRNLSKVFMDHCIDSDGYAVYTVMRADEGDQRDVIGSQKYRKIVLWCY